MVQTHGHHCVQCGQLLAHACHDCGFAFVMHVPCEHYNFKPLALAFLKGARIKIAIHNVKIE